MKVTELLLLGTAGWSGLGVLGVLVSWIRGEKLRVRRGIQWLVVVWMVYLSALIGVSLGQKQKVVEMGKDQCFDQMCFAVTGVKDVPGFLVRDGRHLIQVSIRVTNRGRSTKNDEAVRAYLVDGQGRRWQESSGVNGVAMTVRVAGGDSVVSEPVFMVAEDSTELRLILTHGWRQPGVLVIGDSDSLLHRRTVVQLER